MEIPSDVLEHYARGREASRLERRAGRLEALRTMELVTTNATSRA